MPAMAPPLNDEVLLLLLPPLPLELGLTVVVGEMTVAVLLGPAVLVAMTIAPELLLVTLGVEPMQAGGVAVDDANVM